MLNLRLYVWAFGLLQLTVQCFGDPIPSTNTKEQARPIRETKACEKTYQLSPGDSHKLDVSGLSKLQHDTECNWLIVGSKNCKPQIDCAKLDLNSSHGCSGSTFTISDGVGGERKICGQHVFKRPLTASSQGRDLFVRFQADRNKHLSKPFHGIDCEVSCSSGTGDPLPHSGYRDKEEYKCVCGTRNSRDRIVGGKNANRRDFPWQVAIVKTNTRAPFCGGSIINNRYILTAAHCFWFAKIPAHDVEVLVGGHVMDFTIVLANATTGKRLGEEGSMQGPGYDLPKLSDAEDQSKRYKVEKIINHPLFNPGYDFDVALLKLDRKLDLTGANSPSPICLPKFGTFNETFDDRMATVTGWGLAHETAGATTRLLQKLDVPIIPLHKCKEMMPQELTSRMLCAGFEEGKRDACTGDSGGPLAIKTPFGQYQQVGIVSWGEGCAREKRPGMFSRVTEFIPWIHHHAGGPGVSWCRTRAR